MDREVNPDDPQVNGAPGDLHLRTRQSDAANSERPPRLPHLSGTQRRFLIQLARSAIEAAARRLSSATPKPDQIESPLLEKRACFITLEKQASLRGCIGHLIPSKPLYEAVIDAARQAALADPRFASVHPEELHEITLEISLLSDLIPLDSHSPAQLLSQLQPGRHGVVLQFQDRMATFLPQVWDKIPDPSDFLDRLALKGGWEPSIWRDSRARVSVYEIESLEESEAIH